MPVFCTFDRVAGLNFNKDKQGRRKQVKDNNDGEALPQVIILKDKGENQITIEDDNLSHSIKDSHFVGCLFFDAINTFSDSIVRTAIKRVRSNRIYKNITQCHPRCHPITRFRQYDQHVMILTQ